MNEKQKLSRILIATFILISLLLNTGCGFGVALLGLFNSGKTSNIVKISPLTKVMDNLTASKISSVSADKSTIVFDESTPLLQNMKQGNILVSDINKACPDGLLRRVKTINEENGKVVVQTEQASLEEVIEQGEVKLEKELSPSDLVSATPLAEGVSLSTKSLKTKDFTKDIETGFKISLTGVKLDYNTANTKLSAKLEGSTEFKSIFRISAAFEGHEVKTFELSNKIEQQNKFLVSGTAAITAQSECKAVSIANYEFAPFTIFVGFVPIVIKSSINIKIGVSGTLEGSISYGIIQKKATSKTGIMYIKGSLPTLINERSIPEPPQTILDLKIKATLDFYASAGLKILLYGVAGPEVSLEGRLSFGAEENKEAKMKYFIKALISVKLGLTLEIIGINFLQKMLADITKSSFKVIENSSCKSPEDNLSVKAQITIELYTADLWNNEALPPTDPKEAIPESTDEPKEIKLDVNLKFAEEDDFVKKVIIYINKLNQRDGSWEKSNRREIPLNGTKSLSNEQTQYYKTESSSTINIVANAYDEYGNELAGGAKIVEIKDTDMIELLELKPTAPIRITKAKKEGFDVSCSIKFLREIKDNNFFTDQFTNSNYYIRLQIYNPKLKDYNSGTVKDGRVQEFFDSNPLIVGNYRLFSYKFKFQITNTTLYYRFLYSPKEQKNTSPQDYAIIYLDSSNHTKMEKNYFADSYGVAPLLDIFIKNKNLDMLISDIIKNSSKLEIPGGKSKSGSL